MRIGKQDDNFTAIATSDAESITVRGMDLCSELIGKVGFTDYFFFLVTGKMPRKTQRFFTDAVMVAIAEHGLVPSVQAARMTRRPIGFILSNHADLAIDYDGPMPAGMATERAHG